MKAMVKCQNCLTARNGWDIARDAAPEQQILTFDGQVVIPSIKASHASATSVNPDQRPTSADIPLCYVVLLST